MDTSSLAEQKISLFQKIMTIENEKVLSSLSKLIDKLVTGKQSEDISIDGLSFEEWNELFMEQKDLQSFIPEYNMTLREYRKKIFEAEKSKSYPIEQFLKKLESYV